MIDRLIPTFFRSSVLAPSLRPRIHEPIMDRKTRADVRREILAKLAVRFKDLGVSNS